jgi:hypothetical protein
MGTGTFIVKFNDDVLARSLPDNRISSRSNRDLSDVALIIRRNNLSVNPLFELGDERLESVQRKALSNSGTAQPDLGGMMRVSGPRGRLELAARAFNDLDSVEFVEFELETIGASYQGVVSCCLQNGMGAPIEGFSCSDMRGGISIACIGACCFSDPMTNEPDCASDVTQFDCTDAMPVGLAGSYSGPGSLCLADGGTINCDTRGACCDEENDLCITTSVFDCVNLGFRFTAAGVECDMQNTNCDDPACGDVQAGNCFTVNPTPASVGGQNLPFCDIGTCCTAVCQILPRCCDDTLNNPGDWDQNCVSLAQNFRAAGQNNCFGPDLPSMDPCVISGTSCFTVSGGPGCSDSSCCRSVCSVDPLCCDANLTWDDNCILIANSVCSNEIEGVAPDYFLSGAQGYATAAGWQVPNPFGGGLVSGIPEEMISGIFQPPCEGDLLSTGPLPQVFSFAGNVGAAPGYTGEGFDLAGMDNIGAILGGFSQGSVAAARGQGVRIGVIENGAYIEGGGLGVHEELVGRVQYVAPPGYDMLPPPFSDPNHGTAVLGIIGANPDNTRGIRGMAPNAELFFFPSVTDETGGRLLAAWVDAIDLFSPGDIILVPQTILGVQADACGMLLSRGANWVVARLATDAGIINVVSAGNNSCDLLENPQSGDGGVNGNDSGAIVVGATTPGSGFGRLPSSNHCNNCDNAAGDNVHVSAWGAAVTTLGYRDLFAGGISGNYTNSFGYTSAASAQIASIAARYQGIAKGFYDVAFSPLQVRGDGGDGLLFERGLFHPDFQVRQNIGEPAVLGVVAGFECLGDLDPREDGNFIAGVPDAVAGAAWIVTGQHFGASAHLLQNVVVVRGNLINGSHFSLGAEDNNLLVVETEYTMRGISGTREVDGMNYLGSGQIADIVVDLRAELNTIQEMSVIHTVATTHNRNTSVVVMFTELYNWETRRWDFVNFNMTDPIQLQRTDLVNGNPQSYLRASDNLVKVRLYTLGLGGGLSTGITGGQGRPYDAKFDFLTLDVGDNGPGGITPGNIDDLR